jgi:hypothetical protein
MRLRLLSLDLRGEWRVMSSADKVSVLCHTVCSIQHCPAYKKSTPLKGGGRETVYCVGCV